MTDNENNILNGLTEEQQNALQKAQQVGAELETAFKSADRSFDIWAALILLAITLPFNKFKPDTEKEGEDAIHS